MMHARISLALSLGSCHLLKLHKWPTVVSRHMAAYMRTPFLVTFMLYCAELMELGHQVATFVGKKDVEGHELQDQILADAMQQVVDALSL